MASSDRVSNRYLLAVNCGSSSIKGKLYEVYQTSEELRSVAILNVSNINAKGEKLKIKVKWSDGKGDDVNKEEDGDDIERECTEILS